MSDDLVRRHGGIYWFSNGVNWSAIVALVVGAGGSVLFTNATLFSSPLTTGPLGGADLSIPVGMIVGGGVYYTFNRRQVSAQASVTAEESPDAVSFTPSSAPLLATEVEIKPSSGSVGPT